MRTVRAGPDEQITRTRALAHTQRQAALLGQLIPTTLDDDPFPEEHHPLSLSHIDQGLKTSRTTESGT
ncbi:hypothetical protein KKI23_01725 [Patescibacteria group bacterium]|nr:hypothetical protein [Patescibacteria group bacterium]